MPTHSEVIETLAARNESLRRALCVVGAHFSGEPDYTRVRAEVAIGDALAGTPVEPDNIDLDIVQTALASVEHERNERAILIAECERLRAAAWAAIAEMPDSFYRRDLIAALGTDR